MCCGKKLNDKVVVFNCCAWLNACFKYRVSQILDIRTLPYKLVTCPIVLEIELDMGQSYS